jgi:hypothetical protein
MSSPDSKPQFSVDSFDNSDLDDIAQLFDGFEQEYHEPDPHLEKWVNADQTGDEPENKDNQRESDGFAQDLLSLFQESSPPQSPKLREKDRITFSSPPSEEELVDLFGEFELESASSSSSSKPSKTPPASLEPDDSDQDLLALFEDDEDETNLDILAEAPSTPLVNSSNELDDLKSLFIDDLDDQVEAPQVSPTTSQRTTELLPNTPPVFYEVVEELTGAQ